MGEISLGEKQSECSSCTHLFLHVMFHHRGCCLRTWYLGTDLWYSSYQGLLPGCEISSVGYEHFVSCFSTFGSEGNEPSSTHGTWHMWSVSIVWAVDTWLDVALAYGYQYNVLYEASELSYPSSENFAARNQNFVAVSPRRLSAYGRLGLCTFHRPMLPGSPRAFRCTTIVQDWSRDGWRLFPQIDTLLSIWSCFVDFSPTILPNHCAHFPLHDLSTPNFPLCQ